MWFVYVLQSIKKKTLYIGSCEDLDRAMAEHGSGMMDETADLVPLKCDLYMAFPNKKRAQEFEKFLKTPAGMKMLREKMLGLKK